MRKGGSCLLVLVVLALVGALVVVVARLASVEREREEERRAAETKPVEKSPEELRRERINEILGDRAPALGVSPAKALADGSVKTIKRVREQTIAQHGTVKSRLKTAEESVERLRGERKQLEAKVAKTLLKQEQQQLKALQLKAGPSSRLLLHIPKPRTNSAGSNNI